VASERGTGLVLRHTAADPELSGSSCLMPQAESALQHQRRSQPIISMAHLNPVAVRRTMDIVPTPPIYLRSAQTTVSVFRRPQRRK
jgi:hypothetical protein